MTPKARAVALTLGVFVAACCGVTAEGRAPTVYKPSEATMVPVVVSTPTPAPTLPPRAVAGPLTTPKPTPKPRGRISTALIGGKATWYCCTKGYGESRMVAAAGPELRVGKWRGRHVQVCSQRGKCVTLVLRDWCQCYKGTTRERIIDVHPGVIKALGLSLSQGVYQVSVSW